MSIPIKELSVPFPDSKIKRRKGNFGKQVDYAESVTVIQRLNDVLEGQWSFTIIDYRIEAEEVIVHGELKMGGEVHQQFGGSAITRTKEGNAIVSLADDLKAAASDALKKCASSFGVGLYLYCDQPVVKQNSKTPAPVVQNGNGNGSVNLTQEQVAGLFNQAKDAGFQQSDVIKQATKLFQKPVGQLSVLQAREVVKTLNKSTTQAQNTQRQG